MFQPKPVLVNKGDFGQISTPGFPGHFNVPLPMRCVWILQNNGSLLFVYFTQYYLSKKHLYLSSRKTLPSTMSFNELLSPSLSMTDSKEPWSNQTVWTSDIEEDKYLILALNINKTTYNDLHDRVLEVQNPYGFNITFEASMTKREKVYSLRVCNYNGQCMLNSDLSDYFCDCSYPMDTPTIDRYFDGKNCSFLPVRNQCERHGRENGKNAHCKHGQCRYSTSRLIECVCDEGWTGVDCNRQIPDSGLPSPPKQCTPFIQIHRPPNTNGHFHPRRTNQVELSLNLTQQWLASQISAAKNLKRNATTRLERLNSIQFNWREGRDKPKVNGCLAKEDISNLRKIVRNMKAEYGTIPAIDLLQQFPICSKGKIAPISLQLPENREEALHVLKIINNIIKTLAHESHLERYATDLVIQHSKYVRGLRRGATLMIPQRDGICISKKNLTKIGKNLNTIWKVSGVGVRPILRPFSIRVISDTKVTSKVESRFYKPQQIGPRLVSVVNEGELASVVFTVSGSSKNLAVRMEKVEKSGESYIVNVSLAKRFMKLELVPDGSKFNVILRIERADVWDDGVFICHAYDLGDDPKDQGENERRDFSLYPHVQAEARLGVITVPKIKVFPLATTLVQGSHRKTSYRFDYKYEIGNNALSCFESEPSSEFHFYQFQWLKNGLPIHNMDLDWRYSSQANHIHIQQPTVTEYVE